MENQSTAAQSADTQPKTVETLLQILTEDVRQQRENQRRWFVLFAGTAVAALVVILVVSLIFIGGDFVAVARSAEDAAVQRWNYIQIVAPVTLAAALFLAFLVGVNRQKTLDRRVEEVEDRLWDEFGKYQQTANAAMEEQVSSGIKEISAGYEKQIALTAESTVRDFKTLMDTATREYEALTGGEKAAYETLTSGEKAAYEALTSGEKAAYEALTTAAKEEYGALRDSARTEYETLTGNARAAFSNLSETATTDYETMSTRGRAELAYLTIGAKKEFTDLASDAREKLAALSKEATTDYTVLSEQFTADLTALSDKSTADYTALTEKSTADLTALSDKSTADYTTLTEKSTADLTALSDKSTADYTALTEKSTADYTALTEKSTADLTALSDKSTADYTALAEKSTADLMSLSQQSTLDYMALAEKSTEDLNALKEQSTSALTALSQSVTTAFSGLSDSSRAALTEIAGGVKAEIGDLSDRSVAQIRTEKETALSLIEKECVRIGEQSRTAESLIAQFNQEYGWLKNDGGEIVPHAITVRRVDEVHRVICEILERKTLSEGERLRQVKTYVHRVASDPPLAGGPADYHQLAEELAGVRLWELSIAVVEQGLRLFPEDGELLADRIYFGQLMGQGDESMEDYIARLVGLDRSQWTWRCFDLLVNHWMSVRDYGKAEELCLQYKENFPRDERSYVKLSEIYGYTLRGTEGEEKRIAVLKEAVDMGFACPICAGLLASLYADRGLLEEAIDLSGIALANLAAEDPAGNDTRFLYRRALYRDRLFLKKIVDGKMADIPLARAALEDYGAVLRSRRLRKTVELQAMQRYNLLAHYTGDAPYPMEPETDPLLDALMESMSA